MIDDGRSLRYDPIRLVDDGVRACPPTSARRATAACFCLFAAIVDREVAAMFVQSAVHDCDEVGDRIHVHEKMREA